MATNAVATAFVSIVPEMKGIGANIRRNLDGETNGVGEQAGSKLGKGLSSGVTKNFVIGGAVAGVFTAVTNQVMNSLSSLATQAVFTSDATNKFKQTMNFAGIKPTQIDEMTKATQKYADVTVYDLATIQGTTAQLAANGVKNYEKLTEAAGNLNAVAGGNAETFKSVGLVVTQVNGAGRLMTQDWNQLANAIPGASGKIQEALLKNGAYTGNFRQAMEKGQISSQEFNKALLQLGMKPVAVEAAKSTQTFEGALGNLQALIVGKLAAALNGMKPQLTGAINGLTKFIGDAVTNVTNFVSFVQGNMSWIGPLTIGLGLVAAGVTGVGISMSVAAAGGLAAYLTAMFPAIAATWAFTAALLANPITWIVVGIAALIAGIILLAVNWDKVVKWIGGVWDGFVGWIRDGLNSIGAWWAGVWKNISNFFISVWNGIVGFFKVALNFVLQLFLNWTIYGLIIKNWGAISKFFSDVWNGIIGFFVGAWNTITRSVSTGITNVVNFFAQLPGKIMAIFAGAGTWLLNIGKNLIQGLINGASSLLRNIGSFFLNILPGWIRDPFKAALGIHSPSKVFHGFGKNIIQGLVNGLTGSQSDITTTMNKVSDWITKNYDSGRLTKKARDAALAQVKAYTKALMPLAAQHEAILAKLDDASKALADKIQERADFVASTAEKFGSALDIQDTTTAADAIKQLEERIKKNKELASVLADLQKLGLNSDLYGQVLQSGNIDFAKSILAGGAEAVSQLNNLSAEANASATALGSQAGDVLFGQGIRAAEGIVEGLKKQESALNARMDALADRFISRVTDIAVSGQTKTGLKLGLTAMASGGFVNKPTPALIGEAGPEVVTPLKDFERMLGLSNGSNQTVVYNAAPNASLDSEAALLQALKRAKVVAAW